MSEDFCAFALRVSVVLLSGRCYIDFCNCLIHSELLNSVWISWQKFGGNPRLKKLMPDYLCVIEGAVASSRLMELVYPNVSCVLTRRKFQYFVVPLKVFGEAPERVICEGEYSFK